MAGESVGEARFTGARVAVEEEAAAPGDAAVGVVFTRCGREVGFDVFDEVVLDFRVEGHGLEVAAGACDAVVPDGVGAVRAVDGGCVVLSGDGFNVVKEVLDWSCASEEGWARYYDCLVACKSYVSDNLA
jgi:hypothetical protein